MREIFNAGLQVKNAGGPSTSRSSTHPKPRERQVYYDAATSIFKQTNFGYN